MLVVEDEPHVRASCARALDTLGYDVLASEDGEEAVSIFRDHGREIRAVVLDMVMPRMGGRETYLALRALDPDVRVLLTTGFALNDQAQGILDLGVQEFLREALRRGLARCCARTARPGATGLGAPKRRLRAPRVAAKNTR